MEEGMSISISNHFDCEESTEIIDAKKPKSWNIINALNWVLVHAEDSELSDWFWKTSQDALDYLNKVLGLTNIQIVVLALLIEAGEPLSWRKLGRYLNLPRLTIMTYSDEIEQLVNKRWLMRRMSRESNGCNDSFTLANGVITALRNNQTFVPEKIDGFDEQEFVDRLESHLDKALNSFWGDFSDEEWWMIELAKANPQLPLCQEVLRYDDVHTQSLLLMMVFNYAQYADTPKEGLSMKAINKLYPADYDCDNIRYRLFKGSHELIQEGLVEHKCENGIASPHRYILTKEAKSRLLASYKPGQSVVAYNKTETNYAKSHTAITAKSLFYNPDEQEQVDQLVRLLSGDNLASVQQRLKEHGLRQGFACLFYGEPGTGKTETVLQIARMTGRDIIQIEAAGLRDKFVGESEKNIKAVFSHYKEVCRKTDVTPILFFNEADAIINKRVENVSHSTDKMDNSMQNIILQEMESLDGIMIATTNLVTNLDSAFNRRFLFKIEFHQPAIDVKAKIWQSMMNDLNSDEAYELATLFNFTGGQIENIVRKVVIDYAFTGERPTLEQIKTYCRYENVLYNQSHIHIGFNTLAS